MEVRRMGADRVKVVAADGVTGDGWYLFQNPVDILVAREPGQIMPLLKKVQLAVDDGLCAAGFVGYEAAGGLDPAMRTWASPEFPLAWFGLFRVVEETTLPPGGAAASSCSTGKWLQSISGDQYRNAVSRIKQYLETGDTYQVNYTLRLQNSFEGDPWNLFCRMQWNQKAKYSAFIDTDTFSICSVSPELFFILEGNMLVSKPMKGTSRRGLTVEEDRELRNLLQTSEKERAENVMIVDMIRNDMGRIAEPGSVDASGLFAIEQYPTVFQMVSTVVSRTRADFPEIMRALFPCASVTGAPKIRTMEIVKELETGPRGVYTGCIGYVLPGRRAQFNVAIRTVVLDKISSKAEYGVGGGVVWDSDPEREYEECSIKAAVIDAARPQFDLLETMLWEGKEGYFLLDRHLERLEQSAAYFGFSLQSAEIRSRLGAASDSMGGRLCKVRLLVSENGSILIEWEPLAAVPAKTPWLISFADEPVDPGNPFLYHKTTHRAVYQRARESRPGFDDVLMRNMRGEITESTIANVVIKKQGRLLTPPARCGLLPGVFRGWLKDKGEIHEEALCADDVLHAEKVFLINSVRKWIEVDMEYFRGQRSCHTVTL